MLSEKMLKYHKLLSFIIALLFLIGLQKFVVPQPVFRFLLPAFLVYVVGVVAYNRWYLRQIQAYNFWLLVKLVLMLFAAFGLFLIPEL